VNFNSNHHLLHKVLICISFLGSNLAAEPLPNREDLVFYFLMVDRFSNGDPSNNRAGLDDQPSSVHGFDPTKIRHYHGGDLRGVIQRLDYIQGLGCNAIWLSPIFKNRWVQGEDTNFHGYSTLDYFLVDPHFGDLDDLKELVREAHLRGIRIFFDIIPNHTADVISYAEGWNVDYRDMENYPLRDASGFPFSETMVAYPEARYEPGAGIIFPYEPVLPPGWENIKNPAWLNKVEMYHNRGPTRWSGKSGIYGDFYGLDDLFTERKEVVQGMTEIFKHWIREVGIDGWRIDTFKHINTQFWKTFCQETRQLATSLGNAQFFQFGEVADDNNWRLSSFSTQTDVDSVLDFAFQKRVRGFAIEGGPGSSLSQLFQEDDFFHGQAKDSRLKPTFLGNHDMGRFGNPLLAKAEQENWSEDLVVDAFLLAHAIMFFSRGQPILYYGDEQGFSGGPDPDCRETMFGTQVPSFLAQRRIGATNALSEPCFDQTHVLYRSLAAMAEKRRLFPSLRRGYQRPVSTLVDHGSAVAAWTRDMPDRSDLTLILANSSISNQRAQFSAPHRQAGNYQIIYDSRLRANQQLVDSNPIHVVENVLEIQLLPKQLLVLRPIFPENPEPQPAVSSISLISPGADEVLNPPSEEYEGNFFDGRAEISALVFGDNIGVVSFYFQEEGGLPIKIGDDPSVPYRVFWPPPKKAVRGKLIAVFTDEFGRSSTSEQSIFVRKRPQYISFHMRGAGEGWRLRISPKEWQNISTLPWGTNLPVGSTVTSQGSRTWIELPWMGTNSYGAFADIEKSASLGKVFIDVLNEQNISIFPGGVLVDTCKLSKVYLKPGVPVIYPNPLAATESLTLWFQQKPIAGSFGPLQNQSGQPVSYYLEEASEGDSYMDAVVLRLAGSALSNGGEWTLQIDNQKVQLPMSAGTDFWIFPGAKVASTTPVQYPTMFRLYYQRAAGDYGDQVSENFSDFWGLHLWGAGLASGQVSASWQQPMKPTGQDAYGIYFDIQLAGNGFPFGYILHRGNEKDPGPDQFVFPGWHGDKAWQRQGASFGETWIHSNSFSEEIPLPGDTTYFASRATPVPQMILGSILTSALSFQASWESQESFTYRLWQTGDLQAPWTNSLIFFGDGTQKVISLPLDSQKKFFRIQREP